MRFKINDYVKVTEGFTPEEPGGPVHGWQGKIVEVPSQADDIYLVAFDAQTLEMMSDEYLKGCIEEGADGFEYFFGEEDIEPATRRDNDALLQVAIKKLNRRLDKLDEDGGYSEPEMDWDLLNEWLEAFRQSPEFQHFSEDLKEFAADAPETFARFAFDYERVEVGKWTSADVRIVCLDWIPRKMSAEAEFFELFGAGLAAFFTFLNREKRMNGADTLAKTAAKIAPEIPKEAANPEKWGMAKSFMMGALASGYDPANPDEMNAYMTAYNANLALQYSAGALGQPDSFRNYSGSSLVKVKYPDGNVVKCKFSKVEADLRAGKCTIVKKK
jgi:hypothetical protein